jgi:hypothetical protein
MDVDSPQQAIGSSGSLRMRNDLRTEETTIIFGGLRIGTE